jgi:hypothetical protein
VIAKFAAAPFLAPAPAEGRSENPRVLKARRVERPRSHEDIIGEAEKKFPKTLAYLASR